MFFHAYYLLLLLSCVITATSSSSRRIPIQDNCLFHYKDEGNDWSGTCAEGKQQSPIDIDTTNAACDASMVFDLLFFEQLYGLSPVHNAYSLQVNEDISTLFASTVGGLMFAFQSEHLHLHSPAEHTIDGKRYDLEMHIVHKVTEQFGQSPPGRNLAVVAIFFEVNDDKEEYPFISTFRSDNQEEYVGLNLESFLREGIPSPISYYAYEGSLTTPPCTESVNWFIVKTPLRISTRQLNLLTEKDIEVDSSGEKRNSRAIRPLNGRQVKKGGGECNEYLTSFPNFLSVDGTY